MGRIGTRPASPRRNHRHRLTGGTRMNATTTEQLWFLDTLTIVRVPHDQGRDGISVLERLAPFGDSPPLHVHHAEDETFYVLEGELRIRAGDGDIRIGSGEAGLAPSGVPHPHHVESPQGARRPHAPTPSQFEGFLGPPGPPPPRP